MNLTLLRLLLGQPYSHEVCTEIIGETARLLRADTTVRWYFLLLNRIFVYIIGDPNSLRDADTGGPVLTSICIAAKLGVDAIEKSDGSQLVSAANELTAAYSLLS
jgi:hypothetical protein